jgi:hypothetical protein
MGWKQEAELICSNWITVQADKSNQLPSDEMKNIQEDLREIAGDGAGTTSSIVNCEELAKEVEGNSDDLTQTSSLENLVNMRNSSTKVLRTSKRSKRPH